MARVARLDGTGVCHHVLLRGIERRAIFRDDVDRRDFVSRLGRQLTEGYGSCLAWVLMSNHVHLVLRTGMRPLSSVMRRLNGGYARAFNLRHERCGYLFQDRFRSILVQDDAYLREIRANQLRSAGWTLDAVIAWACARLDADPDAVRVGKRTPRESRARAVIATLATRDLVLPLDCVARATGVTSGAVCRAIERGARIAAENEIRLDESGPRKEVN